MNRKSRAQLLLEKELFKLRKKDVAIELRGNDIFKWIVILPSSNQRDEIRVLLDFPIDYNYSLPTVRYSRTKPLHISVNEEDGQLALEHVLRCNKGVITVSGILETVKEIAAASCDPQCIPSVTSHKEHNPTVNHSDDKGGLGSAPRSRYSAHLNQAQAVSFEKYLTSWKTAGTTQGSR